MYYVYDIFNSFNNLQRDNIMLNKSCIARLRRECEAVKCPSSEQSQVSEQGNAVSIIIYNYRAVPYLLMISSMDNL
jgi:hypothetical protein